MNKTELIASISEKSGMSKKDTERALNATVEAITAALAAGEKVQLVGFGTFETRAREARMGRNPKTKQPVEIPATKVPAFKAGQSLRSAVAK